MSEVADAPPQAQESAGSLLRRAREAAGLHVAALAVALKVPVRKLEALEEDRFQDAGDAVFVRALASSVCRTLKVNAQPILERLPQTSAPRLVKDTDGINAPFRAPGDGPQPTWLDTIRQPVPLAVSVLVVGAVVIFFLPARFIEERGAAIPAAHAPQAQNALPATTAVNTAAPSAGSAPPQEAATAMPATLSPPVAPPASVAAHATPVAAPIAVPVTPAASSAASAAQPTTGIVVLRARGDSWVEVVDAKGNVALRKTLAAGETVGATGALPLSVTVGKADLTQVEVRGKPFDLQPVSKDNVARFEVK